MSHFCVLAIGENIEQQLAPFHEFECTGINDEYVQDVDVTEECKEHGLDWHGLEDLTVTDEAQVDREGEHQYGYAVVDADGSIVKAVNRTNPNKKWDWWVVGGRWSGFLKLKATGVGQIGERGLMGSCAAEGSDRADQTLKQHIDLEGMREQAGKEAEARWDRAEQALKDAGLSTENKWVSWPDVRKANIGDIEKARTLYKDQDAVAAIMEEFKDEAFFLPDEFLVSRDEYVQAARDRAIVPYALVKDSQWYAKGEMGWFGMSADELTQEEWNRKVNELIDELPDDTTITVVDCHI